MPKSLRMPVFGRNKKINKIKYLQYSLAMKKPRALRQRGFFCSDKNYSNNRSGNGNPARSSALSG